MIQSAWEARRVGYFTSSQTRSWSAGTKEFIVPYSPVWPKKGRWFVETNCRLSRLKASCAAHRLSGLDTVSTTQKTPGGCYSATHAADALLCLDLRRGPAATGLRVGRIPPFFFGTAKGSLNSVMICSEVTSPRGRSLVYSHRLLMALGGHGNQTAGEG